MSYCTEECEAGVMERGFVSGLQYSLPACAVDGVFVSELDSSVVQHMEQCVGVASAMCKKQSM